MRTITTLIFLFSLLGLGAVEVPATMIRVIDGDTIETSVGKVRLLYVDTPESKANSHGIAMPEGKAATVFLTGKLPKDAKISLRSPGDALKKDVYQRALAVVWLHEQAGAGAGNNQGTPTDTQTNMNLAIIKAGWSPYWRKYGQASEDDHKSYLDVQNEAKNAKVGAWGTVPQWMTDKANETTAPKAKK